MTTMIQPREWPRITIRPIWLSVLGLSWFWTMGATLLTEFPVDALDQRWDTDATMA